MSRSHRGSTRATSSRRKSATPRTRAKKRPVARSTATRRGEYRLLPVNLIVPAPWQPRRLFTGLENLAASIGEGGAPPGVGMLEPLLVRALKDGTFQLVHGARRLRAAQLIAARFRGTEYRVPARVVRVPEHVARRMSQTANLERADPRPVEIALGYQAIRDGLREEVGEHAASLRALAALGWHEKSQVGDYLRIAELLSDGTIERAGFTMESGEPDFERLCRLEKKALDTVARLSDPGERADALRQHAEVRPAGRSSAVEKPAPLTLAERRARVSTTTGISLRVRQPVQMVAPEVAAKLVENDVVPAVLALADRAYGSAGGAGYFVSREPDYAVLVIPREMEELGTAQLERLQGDIEELRRRANHVLRARRNAKARSA